MIEQSQYLLTVHQVELRHGFSSFTPHKGHIPFKNLFKIALRKLDDRKVFNIQKVKGEFKRPDEIIRRRK